jgi:isoleucyl-tRNA synthetase
VLITSRATLHRVGSEVDERIVVTPSLHAKCDRCWHWRADVGSGSDHPTLCGRCGDNLFGGGETRAIA